MYFVFGTVFAAPHMEGVVKQEGGGGVLFWYTWRISHFLGLKLKNASSSLIPTLQGHSNWSPIGDSYLSIVPTKQSTFINHTCMFTVCM